MATPLAVQSRLKSIYRRQRQQLSRRRPRINLSLLNFGRRFFRHFLTTKPSVFHAELAPLLDQMEKRRGWKVARIAPRGSAKSTWSTLINVLKKALKGTERYIIIISDIQPNANKFLKAIKDEIETNAELRDQFPHCRPGPVWREEAIELPNGVRIEALGKGGKIRGRRHRQYRPTLIILDDPQSFDDAYSPAQLEKDFHWLMSDVMKAGDPNTNFLVLGTALADECILCKLAKTPGWDFKRYQSLITEPANMGLWLQWKDKLFDHDNPERDAAAQAWYLQNREAMDIGSQVLWPERYPLVDLMKRRYSEGERAFQSEEQGVPMPPGEAEWPMEYFDWPGFWFDQWPEDVTLSTMALDPSKGKESKAGDYQAIAKGLRTRSGVIYVEGWLEKMDTTAISEFLVDRYYEQPVEAVALEENGFQELLKVPIGQAVKAKELSLRLPLVPITNTVKKEVRIRRLTPYFASHQFRFRNTAGTRLLVDQLKKFPFADHDDGPDALEMMLRVMIKLSHSKKQP